MIQDHPIIQEIKQSGYLPRVPMDFGEAMSMLLRPYEYDMDECIERLYSLPNVASIIIRVINHVAAFNRKIRGLKDAVLYLGADNVRMIAIAHMTRLLLPDSNGRAKRFDRSKYWKHSIGTSIASYMIAEKTGLCDKEKIFTYGLIHDIGTTVLDICLPERLDAIYTKQLEQGVHQIVAEKVVLGGITHADIGMWLCMEWGLPEEITNVVGYHHNPFPVKHVSNEVKILYLADSVSTKYYMGLLGTDTTFIYENAVREALKLPEEFIDDIAEKLPREVDRIFRNRIYGF